MKTIARKIQKKQLEVIAIALTLLIFASCSGSKKESPAADFSENGVLLSQTAITTIAGLNNTIKQQQHQKEFTKIVNDLSPETYVMKSETDYSAGLENTYKINAFRNLEMVFSAYNLQLDANVSLNASGLQGKINAACHALDSLQLSETVKLKNDQIKKHIKGSKFRVEETVYQLTDLFAEVWMEKSQKWFMLLANYQEETDKGIKQIPTSAFNAEKLKTLVKEPYGNPSVLANLYKLQMVKENQVLVEGVQNQMQTVSDAFSLILSVQGELMKRKKDKLKIKELNSRLAILLEQ